MKTNTQNLRIWCKTGNTPDFQSETLGSNPNIRISLELVNNSTKRFNFDQIVKNYHTYKPNTNLLGRQINWLIKYGGKYIGAIGVGSSMMASNPRDKFIGWKKETRLKNLVKTCTNWRYCLIDKTNYSSKILSIFVKEARKEWKKKYGDNLLLIEALVEPPYEGTCYKAAGWKMVGKTKGFQFEWKSPNDILSTDNVVQRFMEIEGVKDFSQWKVVSGKNEPKLIFVKPLHRYWKRELNKIEDE